MTTKEKTMYHYRKAACCKNCKFSEVRPIGRTIGYFCDIFLSRCHKTKVCDKYREYVEKD
jgi:hypothetical protein